MIVTILSIMSHSVAPELLRVYVTHTLKGMTNADVMIYYQGIL
jgi:hypothetical protein